MTKPSTSGICPKCHHQALLKDVIYGQLTFGENNSRNSQMWQCPSCHFWFNKDPT